MKIGFDLDGTLDKPALAALCRALLTAGHEVHIITGIFDEAGEWQCEAEKKRKLDRLNIRWRIEGCPPASNGWPNEAILHALHAVDLSLGIDYRLRDLGMRKAVLSEQLGLDMFFDDSEDFIKVMPRMNGGITLLQVR